MPLTQAEREQVAQAFLKCFGEDAVTCGRTLRYVAEFTVGQTDLLSTLQAQALAWQPFVDAGVSIDAWNDTVEQSYNATGNDL